MRRITATEASRSFSELLNRVRYAGESYVVERNGKPMVEIHPARKNSTVGDFVEFLERTPLPDPDFARDIEEIVAQRKTMYPVDRWDDEPSDD